MTRDLMRPLSDFQCFAKVSIEALPLDSGITMTEAMIAKLQFRRGLQRGQLYSDVVAAAFPVHVSRRSLCCTTLIEKAYDVVSSFC